MNLPDELACLLREVPALSRAYLVGGCVRDSLLGIAHKDFDLEVYGVGYEVLSRALSAHGRVDLVGKSFGVIKFTGQSGGQWDFSLPRRDSKISTGHKGFEVEFDPDIEPRVAASRRDFTINALMFDPRTGEYLDFFGGRDDLQKRVLRHTSSAFVEDPLRVLRGMQFAARFDLSPAPETVELCRSIMHTFPELAVERVGMEWFKWAVAGKRPSAGSAFSERHRLVAAFPGNRGLGWDAAGPGVASGGRRVHAYLPLLRRIGGAARVARCGRNHPPGAHVCRAGPRLRQASDHPGGRSVRDESALSHRATRSWAGHWRKLF